MVEMVMPTFHAGQRRIYQAPGRFKSIRCGRRFGKALALDTPLPSPDGWVLMGDVQEGDRLYDDQGQPCRVMGVFDVPGAESWEVRFCDGSAITACSDHLWEVSLLEKGRPVARIVTTATLRRLISRTSSDCCPVRVRTCEPVAGPDLPGFDVASLSDALISGTLPDRSVFRASVGQRHAVLSAVMARYGSQAVPHLWRVAMAPNGRVGTFADDISELCHSLGMIVRRRYPHDRAVLSVSLPGDGRLSQSARTRRRFRRVVDVRPAPRQDMRCVQVDSPSRLYLAGRSFIPTHNTTMLQAIATNRAFKGGAVGLFAPEYRYMKESFTKIRTILRPMLAECNMQEMRMRTVNGGLIEGWTLNNPDAGRGGEYDDVLIDEAGVCRPVALEAWQMGILPTLMNRRGRGWVFGTPKGIGDDNFFYQISTDPRYEFRQFSAPSWDNPFTPPEEIERISAMLSPNGVRQEIDAEFVDWSGSTFFALNSLLCPMPDGSFEPSPLPMYDNYVFAVMDTTMRGGEGLDGTGVVYFSRNTRNKNNPLTILDWDIAEIEGSLLEKWVPSVFRRLDELSQKICALNGSAGLWIEDKAMGIPLLQSCARRQKQAHPISGGLTNLGKDGRALNASQYIFSGQVKLSEYAFRKQTMFRERLQNHLVSQVTSYKVGDPESFKRQDDLLDCVMYGCAISLGDNEGF